MKKIESGFSLIELLVVVAIIGILAAVGTVGYGNYIKSSKLKALEANISTLGSALGTEDAALAAGITEGVCKAATTVESCVTAIITSSSLNNPYSPTKVVINKVASCATNGEGSFTLSFTSGEATLKPCVPDTSAGAAAGATIEGSAVKAQISHFKS